VISIITLTPALLNTEEVWAQFTVIPINVGEHPQNVEYNPSNGNMYVSNFYTGDISIIDNNTNKVIHTIQVNGSPNVLEYNPSNGNMYVGNLDQILVVDSNTNKVIHTIDAGDSPKFLKYNPSNGNMYIGNLG